MVGPSPSDSATCLDLFTEFSLCFDPVLLRGLGHGIITTTIVIIMTMITIMTMIITTIAIMTMIATITIVTMIVTFTITTSMTILNIIVGVVGARPPPCLAASRPRHAPAWGAGHPLLSRT